MTRLMPGCFAMVLMLLWGNGAAGAEPSLALQQRIPLGEVKGRIDHLAVDLKSHRLFVAELGNDTVAVVDLRSKRLQRRLSGFEEPQGVAYVPSLDLLVVANGGDGSIRSFTGKTLESSHSIKLGSDADNIRIDIGRGALLVGYGDGAIAALDGPTLRRLGDIPLHGHPESFQLSSTDGRLYVNVPDAKEIVIVDRSAKSPPDVVHVEDAASNYAMALDEEAGRMFVAFRNPPLLRSLTLDGQRIADVETCGDADDLFVDRKRHLIYVICGQGVVDVIAADGKRVDRVATSAGARTGLWVPGLDTLFVAAPARGSSPAAILVLRGT